MNPGVLELHSTIMAELVKITSISQTIIHTINFSGTSRLFLVEKDIIPVFEAVQLSAVPVVR